MRTLVISLSIIFSAYNASAQAQISDPIKCSATTQAGNPCSRNVQDGSSLCWQHAKKLLLQDSTTATTTAATVQCSATTKAGNRCKNKTAGIYCRVHTK